MEDFLRKEKGYGLKKKKRWHQQVKSFGSSRVQGTKKQKPEETVLGPELVAQKIKNLPAMQETWVQSLVWKIARRRAWEPIRVFLPGEFHGQRSPVGYSLWGCKESATTEATNTFTFQTNKSIRYGSRKIICSKYHSGTMCLM